MENACPPAVYVPSQRGGNKLVCDGHMYRLNKKNADGTKSWKCDAKEGCKGLAKTDAEGKIVSLPTHSHLPSPEAVRAAEIRAKVRHDAAAQPTKRTARVVADAISGEARQVLAGLPSTHSLKRSAQRARESELKRARGPEDPAGPPNDKSLYELNIPAVLGDYDGSSFIIHDSGPGDDRIVIFGLAEGVKFLGASDMWLADGTFKSTPALWAQTYSVHGLQNGVVAPCLYACLPDKRKHTYRRMWRAIQSHPDLPAPPRELLTDFEIGALMAARDVFPDIHLSGCLFHLGQSVDRQVAALGLRQLYLDDAAFRLRSKSLVALAFLPPQDVVGVFEQMQARFTDAEAGLPQYFEDNYIGRLEPAGRRPPLFPIALWNVHARMAHGYTRTNNAVEGAHNSFANHIVDGSHPKLWPFIDGLKRQQSLANREMASLAAGGVGRETYREAIRNNRLKTLVERYAADGDGLKLCRGVAYNYM